MTLGNLLAVLWTVILAYQLLGAALSSIFLLLVGLERVNLVLVVLCIALIGARHTLSRVVLGDSAGNRRLDASGLFCVGCAALGLQMVLSAVGKFQIEMLSMWWMLAPSIVLGTILLATCRWLPVMAGWPPLTPDGQEPSHFDDAA